MRLLERGRDGHRRRRKSRREAERAVRVVVLATAVRLLRGRHRRAFLRVCPVPLTVRGTVAYSLGYSLLFFMPLLRVAGPEGRVGDICHFLRGLKCACCRRA